MERNFKIMRYKVLGLFFCMSMLLSGCGQKAALLVPYGELQSETFASEETDGTGTQDAEKLSEKIGLSLFASDLCVVPKGTDNEKDSAFHSKSQFLVDLSKNKALYASKIYKKLYPASVTKIVTAYVALKYGKLTDMVTISRNAANIEEPGAKKCGFQEGDEIRLDVLLNSFLVYSGNDAGIAIAEHISGSEAAFAKLMNEEARKLGAVDSHFMNPHGLHNKKHYTTCYDIYLFFQALLENETFNKIISQSSYTAEFKDVYGNPKSLTFATTNRYYLGLAAIPDGFDILGGKTGTTDEAGSCFVVHTKKGSKEYLSFVFKASDADTCFSEMSTLLLKAK